MLTPKPLFWEVVPGLGTSRCPVQAHRVLGRYQVVHLSMEDQNVTLIGLSRRS